MDLRPTKRLNTASYWSHYAQVMEYNRQRIALQGASRSVSFFDRPSFQMIAPHQNFEASSQYGCKSRNKSAPKKMKYSSHTKTAYLPTNFSSSEVEESEGSQKTEFIIDDGFMKFLEISMEHKLKRKKQLLAKKKRENLMKEEEQVRGTNLMGVLHRERKEFKAQLYGQEAGKIMAMENAIEINFNQHKDLHKPIIWPIIPINLKF